MNRNPRKKLSLTPTAPSDRHSRGSHMVDDGQHCVVPKLTPHAAAVSAAAVEQSGKSQIKKADMTTSGAPGRVKKSAPAEIAIVDAFVDQDGVRWVRFHKDDHERAVELGEFSLDGKNGLQQLKDANLFVFGRADAIFRYGEARKTCAACAGVGWGVAHGLS